MSATMTTSETIAGTLDRALVAAERRELPFRHWLLGDVLPAVTGRAIHALPFTPPRIVDTRGKRETNNSTRAFFSGDNLARYQVCADLAVDFQDRAVVRRIEDTCGIDLKNAFLRIEYCQDTGDFWLEPHTDIDAKLYTMLVYLSTDPGSETWGTDIYDRDLQHVGTAPGAFNRGIIFIPGRDTWHGFRKRPISGMRRSLIVNYVKDEWRARHELAFPDRPIA